MSRFACLMKRRGGISHSAGETKETEGTETKGEEEEEVHGEPTAH